MLGGVKWWATAPYVILNFSNAQVTEMVSQTLRRVGFKRTTTRWMMIVARCQCYPRCFRCSSHREEASGYERTVLNDDDLDVDIYVIALGERGHTAAKVIATAIYCIAIVNNVGSRCHRPCRRRQQLLLPRPWHRRLSPLPSLREPNPRQCMSLSPPTSAGCRCLHRCLQHPPPTYIH